MPVRVLKRKDEEIMEKLRSEQQILTSSYIRQLSEKTSYNIVKSENQREVGKKELVLKKMK